MAEHVIDAGAILDRAAREREGDVPALTRGADAALEEPGPPRVDGARGAAALTGGRRPWPVGARTFFTVTGLIVLAVVSVLLAKARHVRQENEVHRREKAAAVERVERRVPDLKLVAPLPAVERVAAEPPPIEPVVPLATKAPAAPSEADLLLQRRLSRGFGPTDGQGTGTSGGAGALPGKPPDSTASGSASAGSGTAKGGTRGGLEEKLEAVELRAASAGVLPDRDYLLTQGAMLDCVLETKVVSSVAGMTSCHLTRDAYSTSGRVVLLDRGSKVVGRYQGGLQQGEPRIFVLWTRVETPKGVVVNLESPGTGALGEAGMGGYVDTHFWDRFGAAILMSVIEDTVDSASARASGTSQGTNVTFTNTSTAGKDVVAKSMQPTVDIPPTLYKNQGERVGIFIARDLDFRGVYGLEPIASTER